MSDLRKKTIAGLLLLTLAVPAMGSSIFSTLGAGLSVQPGSARSTALGGVDNMLADSVYISMSNPAGWRSWGRSRFLVTSNIYTSFASDASGASDRSDDFVFPGFALAVPIYKSFGMGVALNTMTDYEFLTMRPATTPAMPEDTVDYYDVTEVFRGVGGASVFSVNMGGNVTDWLSMGVALDYVFGKLDRSWELEFDYGAFNTSGKSIRYVLSGIALRVGGVANLDNYIVAGTVQLPAKIDVDRSMEITGGDSVSIAGGTFEMPLTFTLGAATSIDRFKVFWEGGMAFWGSTVQDVIGSGDTWTDTWNIASGVERMPSHAVLDPWYEKWTYRAGAHLRRYYTYAGEEPLNEFGLSAGVGIPMRTHMGMLDLALTMDWRGSENLNGASEKIVGIRIGITSTERWFVRRNKR